MSSMYTMTGFPLRRFRRVCYWASKCGDDEYKRIAEGWTARYLAKALQYKWGEICLVADGQDCFDFLEIEGVMNRQKRAEKQPLQPVNVIVILAESIRMDDIKAVIAKGR